ncbi:hypothetical protein Efla_001328 [Eimeria flavescens]
MEAARRRDCVTGTCQKIRAEEATNQVLLLLSQAKIRQQLESAMPKAAESSVQPISRRKDTLAFKAMVALVLGWLKAHNFVLSAAVLCPEAALREADVLSQEECISVLRLPQTLLPDSASPAVTTEQDSSLLDHLVTFAAQNANNVEGCKEKRDVRKGVNSANGLHLGKLSATASDEESFPLYSASRRDVAIRAQSDGNQPFARTSKKEFSSNCAAKMDVLPSHLSEFGLARAGDDTKTSSNLAGWEHTSKRQHLLAAKAQQLKLRRTSKKLFNAIDETKRAVNARLASMEAKHTARIRRLKKALRCSLEHNSYAPFAFEAGPAFSRNSNICRSNANKIIGTRAIHTSKKRTRFHWASLERLLRKNEFDKRITKENASLRQYVEAISKLADAPQGELLSQNMNIEDIRQLRVAKNPCVHEHAGVLLTSCPPSCDAARAEAARAMKIEYEGRISRLEEELQHKASQIRAKEADFEFLFAELDFAREKSTRAQKRARRLQKLYDAARSARSKQIKLASSVSLSLKKLGLADVRAVNLATNATNKFSDKISDSDVVQLSADGGLVFRRGDITELSIPFEAERAPQPLLHFRRSTAPHESSQSQMTKGKEGRTDMLGFCEKSSLSTFEASVLHPVDPGFSELSLCLPGGGSEKTPTDSAEAELASAPCQLPTKQADIQTRSGGEVAKPATRRMARKRSRTTVHSSRNEPDTRSRVIGSREAQTLDLAVSLTSTPGTVPLPIRRLDSREPPVVPDSTAHLCVPRFSPREASQPCETLRRTSCDNRLACLNVSSQQLIKTAEGHMSVHGATESNTAVVVHGESSIQCLGDGSATKTRPISPAASTSTSIAQQRGKNLPHVTVLPGHSDSPCTQDLQKTSVRFNVARDSLKCPLEAHSCFYKEFKALALPLEANDAMAAFDTTCNAHLPVPRNDNEAPVYPLDQHPSAYVSIGSSLPESPESLSNFPSRSCPVATNFNCATPQARVLREADACRMKTSAEHVVSSSSPQSCSPSFSDLLA